jgi:hypothetical protein
MIKYIGFSLTQTIEDIHGNQLNLSWTENMADNF